VFQAKHGVSGNYFGAPPGSRYYLKRHLPGAYGNYSPDARTSGIRCSLKKSDRENAIHQEAVGITSRTSQRPDFAMFVVTAKLVRDNTVAAAHIAIVIIRSVRVRDLSQKERTKNQ
jgi:hypothetical protein